MLEVELLVEFKTGGKETVKEITQQGRIFHLVSKILGTTFRGITSKICVLDAIFLEALVP